MQERSENNVRPQKEQSQLEFFNINPAGQCCKIGILLFSSALGSYQFVLYRQNQPDIFSIYPFLYIVVFYLLSYHSLRILKQKSSRDFIDLLPILIEKFLFLNLLFVASHFCQSSYSGIAHSKLLLPNYFTHYNGWDIFANCHPISETVLPQTGVSIVFLVLLFVFRFRFVFLTQLQLRKFVCQY